MQSSKLSKVLWRLHLLYGADFLWVEVDSFGCHEKPKKFTISYPQEGLEGIYLQSMHLHDIKYCLQICYVITFGMNFHCNIVYVAFHYFA